MVSMGIYGSVHSILAGQSARLLARRWFGAAGNRWYRLAYNLLAAITLAPVLVLVRALPDGFIYRIPMPWMLLSMALQGIAILAMIYLINETGMMTFVGLVSEETRPGRLVTDGLYRWMRHPLYTCGLVTLWLYPTMSWNLLALAIGTTIYILVGIQFEERKLLCVYRNKYADYRRRTPMLIPLPWRLKKP